MEIAGGSRAMVADTEGFCLICEVNIHTLIEDVERAFPESLISEGFAISHDATFDLVDLVESTVLHQG